MLSAGLLLSCVGMSLIGAARDATTLIAGCILAGASPGLVFSPVSEVISLQYSPNDRGPVFSIVNSGEGVGAILCAMVFLSSVRQWQISWLVFAAIALAMIAIVAWQMPVARRHSCAATPFWQIRWLPCRSAWKLLSGSFVLGVTTTTYWTFAGGLVADHTLVMAGLPIKLRILLWIVLGASGLIGVIAAPLLRRFGLCPTYAAAFVATAAALFATAYASANIAILLLGAAAFGLSYIMATSQLGAWALVVYSEEPSAGFGLTFLVFAIGAIVGPAIAGLAGNAKNLDIVFMAAGFVTLAPLLFLPS